MNTEMKDIMEQKRFVLHHILYEMQMYVALNNFIQSAKFKEADTIEKNAVLESYLVHLRNLIYFFSKRKNERYPDDIHFDDVIEGIDDLDVSDIITVKKAKGEKETFSAKRLVNQSVEHIKRIKFDEEAAEKTQELCKQMSITLPKAIQRFVDALDTNLKKESQDKLESDLKRKNIQEIITLIKEELNAGVKPKKKTASEEV